METFSNLSKGGHRPTHRQEEKSPHALGEHPIFGQETGLNQHDGAPNPQPKIKKAWIFDSLFKKTCLFARNPPML